MVRLHGVVARGRPADANGIAPGVPFGGNGCRCMLPELCLGLQMPAADTALPLPILRQEVETYYAERERAK